MLCNLIAGWWGAAPVLVGMKTWPCLTRAVTQTVITLELALIQNEGFGRGREKKGFFDSCVTVCL